MKMYFSNSKYLGGCLLESDMITAHHFVTCIVLELQMKRMTAFQESILQEAYLIVV